MTTTDRFWKKGAARFAQFQASTNWKVIDTELFCCHFAGLCSLLCQPTIHTANWCSNAATRCPRNFPSTSSTGQGMPAPTQLCQVDKLGRPVLSVEGASICNNFNYGSCNYSQCQLLHICVTCHKAHPKITWHLKQLNTS